MHGRGASYPFQRHCDSDIDRIPRSYASWLYSTSTLYISRRLCFDRSADAVLVHRSQWTATRNFGSCAASWILRLQIKPSEGPHAPSCLASSVCPLACVSPSACLIVSAAFSQSSIHPSRLASRTLSIIVRTLGVAVFVADPAVASRA